MEYYLENTRGILHNLCVMWIKLEDRYRDPDVVESILWHLNKTYFNDNEFEYADNLRIAEVGNCVEMNEYEEKRRRGCCGFHDAVIHTKNRVFMVGFNFGH